MDAKVSQKFQSLEVLRQYLVTIADELTQEQANEIIITDKWTLGQQLYHLYLVEKATFESISSRLKEERRHKKTGFKERYRMFLLKIALGLPLKFKAPPVVADSIPENVDVAKLKTEYENLSAGWELLLNVLSQDQLHIRLFKHPVIGPINILQTLDFLKAHLKHHLPQINGLLSKIRQ